MTTTDLLLAYYKWQLDRSALHTEESETGHADYADSDDAAVELLHAFAHHIEQAAGLTRQETST